MGSFLISSLITWKFLFSDGTRTTEKGEGGRRKTSGARERRISAVRSSKIRSLYLSPLCRRTAMAQRQKQEEQLKGKLAAEETQRQVRDSTNWFQAHSLQTRLEGTPSQRIGRRCSNRWNERTRASWLWTGSTFSNWNRRRSRSTTVTSKKPSCGQSKVQPNQTYLCRIARSDQHILR